MQGKYLAARSDMGFYSENWLNILNRLSLFLKYWPFYFYYSAPGNILYGYPFVQHLDAGVITIIHYNLNIIQKSLQKQ